MRNPAAWLVLYWLRFFARLALKTHKPVVIGVTGSVGKTSAVKAVEAALKDYYPTKALAEKNSESGVPLAILGLSPVDYSIKDWFRMFIHAPLGLNFLKGTKYVILEMGIDDPNPPKNMDYLLSIVKPQIAVLINVYPVHSMQFEKLLPHGRSFKRDEKTSFLTRRIADEKAKIFLKNENCRVVVYNRDNRDVRFEVDRSVRLKKLSFGEEKGNDVTYGGYDVSLQGSEFEFFIDQERVRLKFEKYILPQEYFEAFSSAILVGRAVGLSNKKIIDGILKNFHLPEGRASVFAGIKGATIIDSSYNASRVPVLAFLELAYNLKIASKKPLVFVFGDMRELGGEAKHEHEEVAKVIAGTADILYCVGPVTREFVMPLIEKLQDKHKTEVQVAKWFKNSLECGEYLSMNLPEDAIILFKGSQNTIFLEEAIKPILKNPLDAKSLCRQSPFWMRLKGMSS